MADDAPAHFELTGLERRQVCEALVHAFDLLSLEELLSFGLNERLDAITGDGAFRKVVLSVVRWAEQEGRLLELMQVAAREKDGNVRVQQAAALVEGRAAAARRPVPVEDDRPAPEVTTPKPGGKAARSAASAPPDVPTTTSLGLLRITHNVMVQHPRGLAPGFGMSLVLDGTLHGAAGRSVEIVVRFQQPNGLFLFAAPQEPQLRDAQGLAAAGTFPMPVPGPVLDLSSFVMTIPYYALNLIPSGGATPYALAAIATVYVDRVIVGVSGPTPLVVRW